MSVRESNDVWTQSRAYTYWRNPYTWDQRICLAFMSAPEGCAEVYLSFDIETCTPDDVKQEFSVETIMDGERRYMRQERSRRDFLTKRGAQIVARRWLAEQLNGGAQ